MNEQAKQNLVTSLEKRYGKRKHFKLLKDRANRKIYKEDILQPMQPEFRQRYRTAWKNRELMHDAVEREEILRGKQLEEAYRKKPKGIVTVEEKILREIHTERPMMVSEEDIIAWS